MPVNVTFTMGGLIVHFAQLSQLDAKRANDIKKTLTLQTKEGPPGHMFVKYHPLYQHVVIDHKPMIILPRQAMALLQEEPSLVGEVTTPQRKIEPAIKLAEPLYKLNSNQKIAMRSIMGIYTPWLIGDISAGNSGVFLKLKPGHGKTVIALDLCRTFLAHGRRALYVVPSIELARQTRYDAERFLPGIKVGLRCTGETDTFLPEAINNKKKKMRHEVHLLIVVVNSVAKLSREEMACAQFVIYDECHEYCTPTGIAALAPVHYDVAPPAILAMSGTPLISKLSGVLSQYVNSLLDAHQLEGYKNDLVKFTTTVQPIKYLGPPAYTVTQRREIQIGRKMTEPVATDLMLKEILADPWRMQMILEQLDLLLKKNHCVFLFADRREFLQNLLCFLQKRLGPELVECPELESGSSSKPKTQVGLLIGQERADDIVEAKRGAHVILCTYAYAGTGISLPRMTAILLASPRKAKTDQTVARILRLDSDASIHRIVIDIVDENTPLRHQFFSNNGGRVHTYRDEEFTVAKEKTAMFSDYKPTPALIPEGARLSVRANVEADGELEDILARIEPNDERVIILDCINEKLNKLAHSRGWILAPVKRPDMLLQIGGNQKIAEAEARRLQCRLEYEAAC